MFRGLFESVWISFLSTVCRVRENACTIVDSPVSPYENGLYGVGYRLMQAIGDQQVDRSLPGIQNLLYAIILWIYSLQSFFRHIGWSTDSSGRCLSLTHIKRL